MKMKVLELEKDFSLIHTLECGQFFRWDKVGDWYYIMCFDTLTKIRQKGNTLHYITRPDKSSEFISQIFRLDDDLNRIIDEINKDDLIASAIKRYRGLKIMRQEPFECLISYVCSANSSIPNIKNKLNKMAELFGEEIELDGYIQHTFPKPDELASASLEQLKKRKIGYHSKYIKDVASAINSDDINLCELSKMSYRDARDKLLKVFRGKGVGEKVADCVCLFSLEKLEAFPVDIWVERIMREYYFGGKKPSKKEISQFARDYFGNYAGYAQQYLYHFRRSQKPKN